MENCNHKVVITFFGPFCTTTIKDDLLVFYWTNLYNVLISWNHMIIGFGRIKIKLVKNISLKLFWNVSYIQIITHIYIYIYKIVFLRNDNYITCEFKRTTTIKLLKNLPKRWHRWCEENEILLSPFITLWRKKEYSKKEKINPGSDLSCHL